LAVVLTLVFRSA